LDKNVCFVRSLFIFGNGRHLWSKITMSNGATHFKISIASTIAAVTVVYSFEENLALPVLIGCAWATIVTPDMDVDGGMYSMYLLRRNSRFASNAFKLFWTPYAKLFKHRGVSHLPFIGTATRFAPVLAALFLFSQFVIPIDWLFQVGVFIGASYIDCFHILADEISSWFKKVKRKLMKFLPFAKMV
jgi:uncharacterized metal-binding protein